MFDILTHNTNDFSSLINQLISENINPNEREILSFFLKLYKCGEYDNYPLLENNNIGNCIISSNETIFVDIKAKKFWEKYKPKMKRLNAVEQNGICPICGIGFNNSINVVPTLDHILPKSKFQQLIIYPDNLVFCCKDCNINKHDYYDEHYIFHPYFSTYNNYCNELILQTYFSENKQRWKLKLSRSVPEPIRNLFYNIYSVPNTYEKYLKTILNIEISSIEAILESELATFNNMEDKIEYIKKYLVQVYHINAESNINCKSDTEKILLKKMEEAIKQNSSIFASEIYKKLNIKG